MGHGPKGRSGDLSLRAHFVELRKRLVRAVLGMVVGTAIGWLVYDEVFAALQQPLLDLVDERDGLLALNFSGVVTSFDMKVKVSLFLGVLVSSPWWTYQLWAFITPGLTRRERRYAVAFVLTAAPLFLMGAYAASRVLPAAIGLLTEFTPGGAANLIDAQQYLSFVMRVILGFGFAFLLPVVMVALNSAGLVTARTWAGGWRWAVVLAFVFSAVMTPTPDAMTMIAMALLICGLYAGALGICILLDRRRARVAGGSRDGTAAEDRVDLPEASRRVDAGRG